MINTDSYRFPTNSYSDEYLSADWEPTHETHARISHFGDVETGASTPACPLGRFQDFAAQLRKLGLCGKHAGLGDEKNHMQQD